MKQCTQLIKTGSGVLGEVYRCEPSDEDGLKPFAEFCANDDSLFVFNIMGDGLLLYKGEIDALIDVLKRVKSEYKKKSRRRTQRKQSVRG